MTGTAADWVRQADGSNSGLRRSALSAWAKSNGYSLDTIDQLIQSLQDPFDNGTVYHTVDAMVKSLKKSAAPSTVLKYRNIFPKFFRYADIPFNPDVFDDRVGAVKKVATERRTLKPDQAKRLMEILSPHLQALLAVLISTGHRITSVLNLELADLDFSIVPARAHFRPSKDKEGVERISFLSPYTVDVVNQFLQNIRPRTKWLFPAPTFKSAGVAFDWDRHLSYRSALEKFRDAFNLMGMTERSDITGRYLVRPHGFRNLNLNIAKASKFPWDWAEHLVGHSHGVQDSYPGDEVAATVWARTVGPAIDKFLIGRGDWMPSW